MQRLIASIVVLGLAGCRGTGAAEELDSVLRAHDDRAVQVAALVLDLDTGETLLARDAQRLLRPASTMKVLTTAAVCRRAPDAALVTTLAASATRGGEVTLTGGADPFLSVTDLRLLVQSLAASGFEGCRAVSVVDSLAGAPRFGEGWMWDDEPAAFMPAISAAPVDGGCVTVEVQGEASGLRASLTPVAGDLRLEVESAPGRLRVSRGRYLDADLVTVGGSLAAGESTTRRITVPDPAAYTASVLGGVLAERGLLANSGAVAPSGAALTVASERGMADVVERTNKESDNLGAELLLRFLGTCDGAELGPASLERGLDALDDDIRGLGLEPADYRLSDGSGVSHYTLVSAELLVVTLRDMYERGGRSFEVFEGSLPIAGVDGTLAKRMRGTAAEGRVHAKTGTISGVSCLTGYVTTASGRHLAFAILVQNFVGSAAPWRELQDAFCADLAEL